MCYQSRRRTLPAAAASLLLLLYTLLIAFSGVAALPLAHATEAHHPGDLWAQLLHADRFKLIKRPFWLTRGSVPERANDTSPQHFTRDFSRKDDELLAPVEPLDEEVVLPKSTARTTIFKGDGGNSRFTIHVHNAPPNLEIARVMQKCLQIIEEAWVSKVEVLMKVTFTDLGEPNTLARGGGTYFVKMRDLFDTVVPVAAAEAIRGTNLNGNEEGDGKYDVLISMNSRTSWFDGTVGMPSSSQYDMVTVLLHEFYHNVIFAGSIIGEVKQNPNAPGGFFQSAYLYKNYRTRFDSFLANKDHCSVLGYLEERQLAASRGVTTNQLLAHACANNQLYFSYGENTRIARLYAPNLFKKKSSIYHLDFNMGPENSIMFPTIRRGSKQHVVSLTIRNIAAATLNTRIIGANRKCRRPLVDPIPKGPITDVPKKPEEPPFDSEIPVIGGIQDEDDDSRVGGLPVWAFVLIILFAILLFLLLLGLCLALLLRKKKRKKTAIFTSSTSRYGGSRTGTGTGTGTGVKSKSFSDYIPGVGGKTSSSKKSHSHSFSRSESRRTSTKHTSHHTSTKRTSSRKTTTSTSKQPEQTSSSEPSRSKTPTCPSTGKSKFICKCHCCCPEPTRPPPVASVHTFDPASVPSVRAHCRRKSAEKKICKTKCEKVCYQDCNYKPASAKSPSKCSKSVKSTTTKCTCKSTTTTTRCGSKHCRSTTMTKCTSSRVPPPSTKPPSTKPPCTKPPSTKPSSSCKPSSSSCPPPPPCKPPARKKCCKSSCHKCTQIVEINVGYNKC